MRYYPFDQNLAGDGCHGLNLFFSPILSIFEIIIEGYLNYVFILHFIQAVVRF